MEIDGVESTWRQQEAGIRQGCPLSPYLFIVYMTIMFADVKATLNGQSVQYRVEGARFDEVLFADDTICISKSTAVMNKMIKAIEEIGHRSGMKLNKAKCEAMKYGGIANVTFRDKARIKEVQPVSYTHLTLPTKRIV